MTVLELVVAVMECSKSEARRLIQQKGVTIGEIWRTEGKHRIFWGPADDPNEVPPSDSIIKVGKRHSALIDNLREGVKTPKDVMAHLLLYPELSWEEFHDTVRGIFYNHVERKEMGILFKDEQHG